ncbi:hypothetical protein [Subtercola vilae]|uniref:hypothetical protein n=1 Tax=Subtercola vilae TaxID=2056433 RepID=UPI0010A9C021|nr:hypothetical protein [Subtercola vilae]
MAQSFGHDLDPHAELSALILDLDTAYRAVAERLPDNAAVRIEVVDGRDRPVLTTLDRLDVPVSLTDLSTAIQQRLPRIDLPELLLEVAGWTGFLTEWGAACEFVK